MKSACKNRCLATILLAICLIVGAPLWAQQKVVHGVVEDLEGNPMPGVSVTVEGPLSGLLRMWTVSMKLQLRMEKN